MKINFEHIERLKSGIVLLLMLGWVTTNTQAQETTTSPLVIETQADIDWKELKHVIRALGSTVDVNEAKAGGFLKTSKYYDKYFKKRSLLAKAFWDNYPQDKRHDEALYLFFHAGAEPYFIPEIISDSLTQVLEAIPANDLRKFRRLLPRDNLAWEQWRKTGDNMVASVLNSNASLERKEAAEYRLICRELRYAIRLDFPLKKETSESQYWSRFEIQYWKHIYLRLENHISKYTSLEIAAAHVQEMLNALKGFSIVATEAYWGYFLKTTGSNSPRADQPGIKALHKLAADNVAAIKALKVVDYTKPLEMKFIAMDGSKIDLADMRGKVVLIDFWATYCSPCIKEMPHVRAMYDKYRDLGFEVIGIAADNDAAKNRIESILKKARANWPQCLDQGSDVSVSLHALYNITSLPTVWLLNKEGVIVDRNARGERLEPLIRKYLGLEKR